MGSIPRVAVRSSMSTSQAQLESANVAGSPVPERRSAPRSPISQRCLVGPGRRGLEGWRCIVYDISATGIGLPLPLPMQPGTILEIEAWGVPAARTLRARVVRTAPVEFLWFCGCELDPPLE